MKKTLLVFCCAIGLLSCKKEEASPVGNNDQSFRIGHYDSYDYHFDGDTTIYTLNANLGPMTHQIDLDGDGEADFSIEANGQGAYRGTHRKWIKVQVLGNQWAMAKTDHQVPLRECLDSPDRWCKRRLYSDNWNYDPCTGSTDRAAGSRNYAVPLRYMQGDTCSASDWTFFSNNSEDRELSLYYLDEDWDYNNMTDRFCHEIYNLYYAQFSQEHYWLFRKTTSAGEQYAWLKLKLMKEDPDYASSPSFKLQILEGACQGEASK